MRAARATYNARVNTPPNIADALTAMARQAPERVAMHMPDGGGRHRALTYGELDRGSDELAAGLLAIGIAPGSRAALMVRPSEALFLLMFALFKARIVPVLIDPGIDKRALKACLAEAAPESFIGIPLAQIARLVLGWARGHVRHVVTVGSRGFWGGHAYARVRALGAERLARGEDSRAGARGVDEHALAAILFTSGSTGVPKGVEYTHGNFLAQVQLIRAAFDIRPGEVDLPTFPPFALFDPGLGMTSVIPEMDPTRPARADPRKLIAAIERFGCTSMFGSPALLDRLSAHAVAHDVRLPSLKRVLSAGAPVRPEVIERAYRMLPPDAQLWTPYGATECLPVAVIEGREVLSVARARTDAGAGICVGRPVPPNRVRVIAISDDPIAHWQDAREVPIGEIGEITVSGPTTTRAYFRRERATALAKIREGETIVHRMGDVGYFDAEGRLWYVGRKSHRVVTAHGTLFSEQVEGIFNAVPGVRRSALLGLGDYGAQRAVVAIETTREAPAWSTLLEALRSRAAQFDITRGLDVFLRHRAFPVDIRHNAKIGREKLALWAARHVSP